MGCQRVKLGDGTAAIVCGGHRRAPVCKVRVGVGRACGGDGAYQCDWKISKRLTCDRHICEAHAQEVSPGKHLCPDHQQAYRIWQSARAGQCSTNREVKP